MFSLLFHAFKFNVIFYVFLLESSQSLLGYIPSSSLCLFILFLFLVVRIPG